MNKGGDLICYEVEDDVGDTVIEDCFHLSSPPVTEIIASGKPSFLIPLPNSLDKHQKENAYELKKQKACIFFEQKD